MAKETKDLEPDSLEWMTMQRDRLKAECDAANTKYDQLVAADKTEQERLQQELEDSSGEIADLEKQLRAARELADLRRAALADVMRAVAVAVEKIAPLLTE